MRVLEPSDGILAFYDGREDGATLDGANWVEYDLELGIASYAVTDDDAAVLDRLAGLAPARILPAHGDPEAAG